MSLLEVPISRLDGTPSTVGELTGGKPALIVNVASRCGYTSQYQVLQRLQETYSARGFTVEGVPCNQFGGQEPGTAEEIGQFCSTTYGVTFPLTEKVDVIGPARHPLYAALAAAADAGGEAGDVGWNFEKFLVDGNGRVVRRFRTDVEPDDPEVVAGVESVLSGS